MTEQPQRPTALQIIPDNIPAELKALYAWVCWRYEWVINKQGDGKWTKVPYTPYTTKRAAHSRPSEWRSFKSAYACYLERSDFFDGIGFVFSKDDPYVGGDKDHCVPSDGTISDDALALIPVTYCEISPSGCGLKFIARANGKYGRKTAKGELYSELRFFTITGHVINEHAEITECQEAVDAFYASLGGTKRASEEGTPGSGSRADYAAAIPEEEWEAGRQIRRTRAINALLADLRRRAVSSKTGRDDTKLGYIIREDYRGYHDRWPNTGIVRGDGSIDSSQIRMVMANSIKGRGYTRPQFIALMSYFYGAECLAKWKFKERVKEEIATLWFKARGKRTDEYVPQPVEPAPRGKAGDHSELLEKAYQSLLDFRAGTEAILTTQDLADALGIVRRTACKLLYELTRAERITYRSARNNSGIIVSFIGGGVIYSENVTGNIEHKEHTNGHRPDETIAAENTEGVIYSENSMDVLQHKHAENDKNADPGITAEPQPLVYIYKCNTVSLAGVTITPRNRVTIDDAVQEAYDNLPRDRVTTGGELKKWPVTVQRVREYVEEHYPGQWKYEAIRYRIEQVKKRRKAQTFDHLKGLKREVIDKKAAAIRKGMEHFEQKAVTAETDDIAEYFKSRAAKLSGPLALLGWEQQRRDTADDARIATQGYTAGEQQEMLELVERERRDTAPSATGLIARLQARKRDGPE